jgi:hypothetical protein
MPYRVLALVAGVISGFPSTDIATLIARITVLC